MDDRNEPISRQFQRQGKAGRTRKWLLFAALLAVAGYVAWRQTQTDAVPSITPAPVAVPAEQPSPPQADTAGTQAPLSNADEHHPLEAVADDKGNPVLAADATAAFEDAVVQWLGRERSLRFVATDGLANRVVATIDNLPRHYAASRLWPLFPVGGRMAVVETGTGLQISPDNAARYEGIVGFLTGLDLVQAAALYKRAYPVLQQSYEGLGYPGKHFNDRLVAVIDHLLKTPEPDKPLMVKLVQVQGQVPVQQPWLRYEFVDPRLESLSAGQKILLRIGAENARRIKVMLRGVRAQIVAPPKNQ